MRVFEWVVKRARLGLTDGNEDCQSMPLDSTPLSVRQNGEGSNSVQSNWKNMGSNIQGLPDEWINAFLNDHLGAGFEDDLFNF
jgi:hypothetical protein